MASVVRTGALETPVRSVPAKPTGGVAVNPIRDPDDDHDRRLGQSVDAQLAHKLCELVRADRVEPPRREAWEQVLVHSIAIAVSRRRPQVDHGTLEPARRGVPKPQPDID